MSNTLVRRFLRWRWGAGAWAAAAVGGGAVSLCGRGSGQLHKGMPGAGSGTAGTHQPWQQRQGWAVASPRLLGGTVRRALQRHASLLEQLQSEERVDGAPGWDCAACTPIPPPAARAAQEVRGAPLAGVATCFQLTSIVFVAFISTWMRRSAAALTPLTAGGSVGLPCAAS